MIINQEFPVSNFEGFFCRRHNFEQKSTEVTAQKQEQYKTKVQQPLPPQRYNTFKQGEAPESTTHLSKVALENRSTVETESASYVLSKDFKAIGPNTHRPIQKKSTKHVNKFLNIP